MNRTSLALLAMLLSGATAIAAPSPSRVRGTLASVAADKVVVHTTEGKNLSIALNADTKYLQVVKSGLDKVEKDAYIGAATKSIGATQVALEVVVFPPSMKGVGEGHYPWDKLPDTTLAGKTATASSMTNGSVASVAAPSKHTANSAMTNGSIAAASVQNDVKKLTVTYKGGEQTIVVPPTAPIVTFRPGSKSDLTTGAAVFVQATMDGDTGTAGLVAVGVDGVKPPM